jgi:hypothetical protein
MVADEVPTYNTMKRMDDRPDTTLRLAAGAPEPGPRETCNHRAHAREFARDERGTVRMLCRGCGREVVPASRRDAA